MSQVCELTGKRPNYGNNRSHANNKTRTRWELNLKHKKYFIPELGRAVRFTLSTRAIRTIDRYGNIVTAIMKAQSDVLSQRMQQFREQIYKRRVKSAQPKSSLVAAKSKKKK